jgi:hypothetical protein
VPEPSNFVLTLTQADALGMPVGRARKTSLTEMRSKRQPQAREAAAELPGRIRSPMILRTFVVPPDPEGSAVGGGFG